MPAEEHSAGAVGAADAGAAAGAADGVRADARAAAPGPAAALDRELGTAYYNRTGAVELMRRLREETLLAQGPMGSVLMSQVGAADIPAAFWNLAEPQTVANIHRLYAAAGAQVLITNTFQASAPALDRDEIMPDAHEVNRAAVNLARAARPEVLLGSIGPCGITWFHEDEPAYRVARAAYREQAHALLTAGVDGVLLETFTSIRDLQPALAGVGDAADGMPVLVSFAITDAGDLIGDGLTIEGAIVYAERHGACAVGVNCCSIAAATAAVPRMVAAARTPVMVRPNAGDPVRTADDALAWHEDSAAFARACRVWRDAGAHLVGACCGATAATTVAMADALNER